MWSCGCIFNCQSYSSISEPFPTAWAHSDCQPPEEAAIPVPDVWHPLGPLKQGRPATSGWTRAEASGFPPCQPHGRPLPGCLVVVGEASSSRCPGLWLCFSVVPRSRVTRWVFGSLSHHDKASPEWTQTDGSLSENTFKEELPWRGHEAAAGKQASFSC